MDDFYNPILATDSYNTSHYKMLPKGVKWMQAYWGPRPGGRFDRVLYYGLQAILMKYFTVRVTRAHIEEAQWFMDNHGVPFNRKGWEHILNVHDGYLPLKVRAIPEGMMIGAGIPPFSVTNTDRECAWLVTYLEPLFHHVWYPTAVATLSREIRVVMEHYWKRTVAESNDMIEFALHDFGMRGATSYESACVGTSAHLLTFNGTDTMPGIQFAMKYYNSGMTGHSVAAANHAVVTAWGKDRETDAYENMINTFGDKIVSIVSDAYDIENAVRNIFCGTLKTTIEKIKGRLVIRPDSGDPIAGVLSILDTLEEHYPISVNSLGYKVLPDYLRVLWGDGIDKGDIAGLLSAMAAKGWASNNLICGMGGALLQKVNRDDGRFSMKACAVSFDLYAQKWETVQKVPKSDPSKASIGGRINVIRKMSTGELQVDNLDQPLCNNLTDYRQLMNTVFEDGKLLITYDFDEVIMNSHIQTS